MANPVNPTAAGGINPTSSIAASLSSPQQPVVDGRRVAVMDATAQTQHAEAVIRADETVEGGGYLQKLRAGLPGVGNVLPRVRDRLFGSATDPEVVGQPGTQPTTVAVYHKPTNWERTFSVVNKVAKVIVAPIEYLVWKPLKFFCVKASNAKTYLFNHENYAAAKKAEFAIQHREHMDHARYMNERCVNATARMKVIEENLEAKAQDRVPYVRALSEMAPILKQRRQALDENQAKSVDVEKFREFGVVPDEHNNRFIEAMTEYNGRIAEFKVAEAQYNAAVAWASKKGRQLPAMPSILAEKPEALRFRCTDAAVIHAFHATNDKPLLKRKTALTERLEALQAQQRDVVLPGREPLLKITSAQQRDLVEHQIDILATAVEFDRAAQANATANHQEAQGRIDANVMLIEFKRRLIEIFDIEQELIALDRALLPIQASRAIDVQEWKEGVVNPDSGEVEQVGRDRLSLDAIKPDVENLKTDSNGNVIHLAYVIDRPLINAVREEHPDRDARDKGLVWRKASAMDRPVASYAVVRNRHGEVVGSCAAVLESRHWYVRDEPVVHVKGYDKRHLAVEFVATDV